MSKSTRYKQRAHGTLDHRLVMISVLGRPLGDDEVVHHMNLNKMDNDPKNLITMSKSKHAELHNYIRWHGVAYAKTVNGGEFSKFIKESISNE